jgi:hypothetical protein
MPEHRDSLWTLIKTDLVRARSTLPDDAASHKAIHHYQDFLDHIELELACDMLELLPRITGSAENFGSLYVTPL